MAKLSSTHGVSLFHSLGNETVKHGGDNRNNTGNNDGTSSLKALANKVLQRNIARNKPETNPLNGVSSPSLPETKQMEGFNLPSLIEDYEERIAIAEYDGSQGASQAHRIAYQDALITALNANPPDDRLKVGTDWLTERIKAAQDFLMTQGITQPE